MDRNSHSSLLDAISNVTGEVNYRDPDIKAFQQIFGKRIGDDNPKLRLFMTGQLEMEPNDEIAVIQLIERVFDKVNKKKHKAVVNEIISGVG